MTLKQFLKPDWRKIVIFVIILALVVIIIPLMNSGFGRYTVIVGFPLIFYEETFWPSEMEKTNFLVLNFIIDIIVLYIFSCLIIWIYDKSRKKKK
jgi:hypothetical protein